MGHSVFYKACENKHCHPRGFPRLCRQQCCSGLAVGAWKCHGRRAQPVPFPPTEPNIHGWHNLHTPWPLQHLGISCSISQGSQLLLSPINSDTCSSVLSPPGNLPGERSRWKHWLSGQHKEMEALGAPLFLES